MPIVKIGPTYSLLQKYNVNDEKNPIFINSAHFTGYITFRIKNHNQKDESVIETCEYFENYSRLFSIQFQGRFKSTNPNRPDRLWSFDDIFFCAETEESISPPIGLYLAVKFARFIDPAFIADKVFDSKRPWCGSPLICGMNVVNITKIDDDNDNIDNAVNVYNVNDNNNGQNNRKNQNNGNNNIDTSDNLPMNLWVNYGKNHIKEDTSLIHYEDYEEAIKFNSSKRRYHFLDPSIRRSHFFDPSFVYTFDFFNNFTDFSNMTTNMIISFTMKKILENQPLKFVCRNYDGDAVFFVIEIDYSDIC